MGRPLKDKYFKASNDNNGATMQIQCLAWGANDSASTAGVLVGQKSPVKFKAKTANGTSQGKLTNGPAPTAAGQIVVKCFPEGTAPTVIATANATLGVTAATVTLGGSGYAVNDYVTLTGGTFTGAANVKVLTVNGNGAILTVGAPVNALGTQKYTALPSNIANVAVGSTTGTGNNATFSCTFGLDTSYITGTGNGYVTPVMAYSNELTLPVVTAPTVVSGNIAVQQLTITSRGSFSAMPNVIVDETTGVTEYVKSIDGHHYLTTFAGNHYRFVHHSGNVLSSWGNTNVAFLDTL